jgi:hypothetical protein
VHARTANYYLLPRELIYACKPPIANYSVIKTNCPSAMQTLNVQMSYGKDTIQQL